ncbi:MAG: hypothetical protein RSE41_07535 [Clostridia bacterium]
MGIIIFTWLYVVPIVKSNVSEIYSYIPEGINQIENIIKYPTYIAKHPKDGSIEYIKKYILNNEYVFVAVRVTSNNINFVRTMFVMTDKKVNIYINNNYFIDKI